MSLPEKRTTKTRDFVDKVLHWTHVTYSGSMKRLLHDTKSRQEECICVDQLDVDWDVDGYGFERFPSSSLSSSSTSTFVTSNDVGRVLHTCLRHEMYHSRLWNQVDVYALVADY